MATYKSAKAYNQMSDEMEGLDDELRSLCAEIRKDLSAFEQTNESLSSDQVSRTFITIKGKVDSARSLFQKCKLELRELSKDQHTEYEPKLKEHARVIDELTRKITSEKERVLGVKSKDTGKVELFGALLEKQKESENGQGKDAQQLIKDAKSTQSQSIAAVNRMQVLVNESEDIGINTNAKLKIQTEQMGNIKSDVDKVQVYPRTSYVLYTFHVSMQFKCFITFSLINFWSRPTWFELISC